MLLFSAYLSLATQPTSPIKTGTTVNGYSCKDPFKALKHELNVLCYDETFIVSNGIYNDTSSVPNGNPQTVAVDAAAFNWPMWTRMQAPTR